MAMITTTKGLMDEDLLRRKAGFVDNDHEYTTWVEYWLDNELVHRSAHVTLKKIPSVALEAAALA
jgi:hypothetical protein